ncbi:hypothetical protein CK203_037533 [Vitis vinifera]|uniref:Uncharacterized protein n=1 Tax=Vitis vinifera TaxID=29760 RepID=A0A438HMF4_VITVI|nr:hypothetical protein CK203_037533 [Vitis vinifera]
MERDDLWLRKEKVTDFTDYTLFYLCVERPEGQIAEKLNVDKANGLTLQRAAPLMVHPQPRLSPQGFGK